MPICIRCGEPHTFCRCWSILEIVTVAVLAVIGFLSASRAL